MESPYDSPSRRNSIEIRLRIAEKQIAELKKSIFDKDSHILELQTTNKLLNTEFSSLRVDYSIRETEIRRLKTQVGSVATQNEEEIETIKKKADQMKNRIRSTEDLVKGYSTLLSSSYDLLQFYDDEILKSWNFLR